ncbi:MAG: ABC transporter permease subunit [Actinophytocola sp.]|uniref:ABC transporter permease n=1 Tax=Actinophytocola sp. TaxID=1872138 RepID=UPI001326DCBE|nr:ABC transporter permease [Actinophytocola sp.]MPZ79487.1 ABC transporter permease subunit [Actinophytocola sp.]
MRKFILRRSAQILLVFVVTTFGAFVALYRFGDPFLAIGEKLLPPDTRRLLRETFGLDQPLPIQYLTYIKNLFTGDLGIDYDQRRPVFDQLAAVAPNTLRLAVFALALQLLIGLSAGVVAAVWHRSIWDVLVTTGTIVLLSVPLLVIAAFLRDTFSGARLFGVPIFPALPRTLGAPATWFQDMLLPAFALAIGTTAFIARVMRSSMLEVLDADYIRTAKAKGLPQRTVVLKHALRNAVLPVANIAAIELGALIGGTIIVEAIFQYNGVGYLFVRSLDGLNYPVMMAIASYSIIIFLVLIAVVDVLCAYLDPRLRVD